jgi:hypothetical protein
MLIEQLGDDADELPFRWSEIDTLKWQEQYGKRTVRGKQLQLCWYHCNRPKGCSNLNCPKSHAAYPDEYNDKPLIRLSSAVQMEVMRRCPRA